MNNLLMFAKRSLAFFTILCITLSLSVAAERPNLKSLQLKPPPSFGKVVPIPIKLISARNGSNTIEGEFFNYRPQSWETPRSYNPVISDDGRYIAFFSDANNLDAFQILGNWYYPDVVNSSGYMDRDVFVRDRKAGTTVRYSDEGEVVSNGHDKLEISGSGDYIVFIRDQHAYRYQRNSGAEEKVTPPFSYEQGSGQFTVTTSGGLGIDYTGNYITYVTSQSLELEDTNSVGDLYLKDMSAGTFDRTLITPYNSVISLPQPIIESSLADNRSLIYNTDANLVADDSYARDNYWYNESTGSSEWISNPYPGYTGNDTTGSAYESEISADGRFAVFRAYGNNLIAGVNTMGKDHIYLRDLETGAMTLISKNTSGDPANGNSRNPDISNDGRYVVFDSDASDLVANDTNDVTDTFVWFRSTGEIRRLTSYYHGLFGTSYVDANDDSRHPAISGNGKYIVFQTDADNLYASDDNNATDIVGRSNPLYETAVTTTIRVHYDVGFGNFISIRGSAPLSWDFGGKATWTNGNVWVYTTDAIANGQSFDYKALINDTTWENGQDHTGVGGTTIDIFPSF